MSGSETLSDDQQRLLSFVPEDGSVIGNTRLRVLLGWEPAHYFEARNQLVEREILSIGRGRGGSVYRLKPIPVPKGTEEGAKPASPQYRKEPDLYKPVAGALREGWSQALPHPNFLVEITAKQGWKKTGGMWTRPDITVITVDTYAYVPGKFIEVITYEIKPSGDYWNVSGVFEAASHSRFATQTYLLVHCPDGLEAVLSEQRDRLQEECARFGIGLGFCKDPASYDTYEFVVEPQRRQPDPAEMNRFIEQQLTQTSRNQIALWLK